MALAAFGKPRFLEEMRKIVIIKEDGDYELDLSYLDFRSDTQLPVSEKFLSVFGKNRSYKTKLPFNAFADGRENIDSDSQRYADIAASAQAVLEEAVLAYAKLAKEKTRLENICYAGGVALNCVANAKLEQSGIFKSIFVPVDPGDGGAALGAALYLSALKGEMPSAKSSHPYHGSKVEGKELPHLIPHIRADKWRDFAPLSTPGVKKMIFTELPEEKFIHQTAERIYKGHIAGWCQGRFEHGPQIGRAHV